VIDQQESVEIPASAMVLHGSATRTGNEVETAPARWSYALLARLPAATPEARALILTVELEVQGGEVGVGVLNAAGDAFLCERTAGPGSRRITLTAPPAEAGALVCRNVSAAGPSRFEIRRVTLRPETRWTYPVFVTPRQVAAETVPEGGGTIVFDDDAASAINVARMDFIRNSGLDFAGRRVLDVGAGVGHFARLYSSLGASVVAVEGRADNVATLRDRYPEVTAHVGDVQQMDLASLGAFDVVHCFGLLYHLDSPVAALRRMEAACGDVLLLETMVCDATAPVMVLADETMAVNQALAGLGCRPSPSFIALALNRVGFSYVYGAARPPDYPDFAFEWRNSLDTTRDGHPLRAVFVASRRPLDLPTLLPLVESS
jgi:SAM-dependent methyltransferase